jgi:hypothetical protein
MLPGLVTPLRFAPVPDGTGGPQALLGKEFRGGDPKVGLL